MEVVLGSLGVSMGHGEFCQSAAPTRSLVVCLLLRVWKGGDSCGGAVILSALSS